MKLDMRNPILWSHQYHIKGMDNTRGYVKGFYPKVSWLPYSAIPDPNETTKEKTT